MAATYSELSDVELVHKVLGLERDMVSTRFAHSMNQLENTAELGRIRKEIARLRTEARRRELENGLAKDSLVQQHRVTFQAGKAEEQGAEAGEGGFLKGIVDKLTSKD